jgi:hypothetical protein
METTYTYNKPRKSAAALTTPGGGLNWWEPPAYKGGGWGQPPEEVVSTGKKIEHRIPAKTNGRRRMMRGGIIHERLPVPSQNEQNI